MTPLDHKEPTGGLIRLLGFSHRLAASLTSDGGLLRSPSVLASRSKSPAATGCGFAVLDFAP